MSDPLYRRVIVKLSGEALTGSSGFGIDQATVERLASDLVASAKLGVELGVVVGGGGHGVERMTRLGHAACPANWRSALALPWASEASRWA